MGCVVVSHVRILIHPFIHHTPALQSLAARGSDLSLGGQLCLTLLRARDTSIGDLEADVWQPCLEAVRSKLGSDVAGVWMGF